jgi:hypothetical protein
MKCRLLKEGNETVTNCNQLKMEAEDGKMRITDVGNVEQIFRLIQSIPSPKAEPFKQWLAKVGYERLQEIQDPSLSMDRARENLKNKGRSEKWIQQRLWHRLFRSAFQRFTQGVSRYERVLVSELSHVSAILSVLFNSKSATACCRFTRS